MLFSGETEHLDEIFLAYIARSSCDEIILKAFLAVKSWLYVMKGEKIDTDIEQYMAQLCDQSDMRALPDICMIALTQSASERVKDLTAEGKDLVERMIRSLWEKGYLFGFYSKFSKVVALPDEFADKAIVAKVDVDEMGELAQRYRIMNIPTLMIFKKGELVDKAIGARPKAALEQMLNKAL